MFFCLVADDEKWIRTALANRVNECRGFTVAGTAAHGQEALEWLSAGGHYADILITDVRMPHMDGLELVRQVNASFPWMRSILISSFDDFEYAKRGIVLGTIDYIVKPVKQENLEEALQKAAAQIRAVRANEARAVLLKHYDTARPLLDKWQEPPGNRQTLSQPILVMDTFLMLEAWSGGRADLLTALADEWIGKVAAARKAEGVLEWLAEELAQAPVPIVEDRRLYFRLAGVYRLERALARFHSQEGTAGITAGRRAIADVKRYVEGHYQQKISLQEIADAVNISKPYLANVFRQGTGMTIWGYLIEVRMRKAKELLLTTDMRLGEVADAVGYTDSAHFAKAFKTHFGMSSTELKNRFAADGG